MLEKKTIVDQIEITRDGSIQVRFALQILEDGVEISSLWHRTLIPPGGDVKLQLSAVNTHLISMGKAPVVDTAMLENLIPVVHTPEVNKRYAEKQAKALEEFNRGK